MQLYKASINKRWHKPDIMLNENVSIAVPTTQTLTQKLPHSKPLVQITSKNKYSKVASVLECLKM
jgi:hypothetical protein